MSNLEYTSVDAIVDILPNSELNILPNNEVFPNGYNDTSYFGNSIDNFYYIVENNINKNKDNEKIINLKDRLLKELNESDDISLEEKSNPLLDEMNEVLTKFKKEYHKIQDDFIDIDNTMQSEIKNIKNNVKHLETMIDFTDKLDDNLKNDEICKEIIGKVNEFSDKIEKNSNFKQAKENYSKKRFELNKYFDIIKSLNNLNVSNTCPLCLTNKIELYINPCGHCCCRSCKERLLQYDGGIDSNCFICRKRINSFNGIYLS